MYYQGHRRKLDFGIVGLLVLALGFVAIDQYVLEETLETEIVATESVDPPLPVAVEGRGSVRAERDEVVLRRFPNWSRSILREAYARV